MQRRCAEVLFRRHRALLLLFSTLAPLAAQAPTWTLVALPTAPPIGFGRAIAADSLRGRRGLFQEDFVGNLPASTWEWDGTDWTSRLSANAPTPRYEHSMAYDRQRRRTVLFGGEQGRQVNGETWEWDGTDWSPRFPAHAPAARTLASMAYDSQRGRKL